jgi:hypothetical protein
LFLSFFLELNRYFIKIQISPLLPFQNQMVWISRRQKLDSMRRNVPLYRQNLIFQVSHAPVSLMTSWH